MSTGCKVCDDKGAALTIDRYLAQGITYSTVARSLTLAGFDVTAQTVSKHAKHRIVPGLPEEAKPSKRDLAIMLRDKVADHVETLTPEELFALPRDRQGLVSAGLKAQGIIDKREAVKAKTSGGEALLAILAMLRLGQAPEVQLIEDGMTIEGEAVEVD